MRTACRGRANITAAPNLMSSVPKTLFGEGLAGVSDGGPMPEYTSLLTS